MLSHLNTICTLIRFSKYILTEHFISLYICVHAAWSAWKTKEKI